MHPSREMTEATASYVNSVLGKQVSVWNKRTESTLTGISMLMGLNLQSWQT